MDPQILKHIRKGELILFLGAGASFGSTTRFGNPVPSSAELAKKMADEAGLPYNNESLDQVYEAARERLGARLNNVLEDNFKHVKSSADYIALSKYVWRRIYTLNIDDGLDLALVRHSPQKINKVISKDSLVERNPFFEYLEYIKLNGSSDRMESGLIFSGSEYAQASDNHLPWYSQCASDFLTSPFLFIGTSLAEPLLKFHIERFKKLNNKTLGTSYLIVKEATPIQIAALEPYKIKFIQGTLSDFVSWLTAQLPEPPSAVDVACESNPALRALAEATKKDELTDLFEHVLIVKADSFTIIESEPGSIKDFYKGFNPTWQDVIQNIPAELGVLEETIKRINNLNIENGRLLPILGPSGSGKTTLLMQVCWNLCHQDGWDVYFIDALPTSLLATLIEIEKISTAEKILIAIDNLELFSEQIDFSLKSGRLTKTIIISAERESAWNRRAKALLFGQYQEPQYVRNFTENDANKILVKLENYGSWTRLGKMSPKKRLDELLERSKKQLLIALLEATLGRGFEEIIEDEYRGIVSEEERIFLTCIAIVNDRRCDAHASLVHRALDKLSILTNTMTFTENLAGIVHKKNDVISVRHPVYARYLLDRIVDPTLSAKAVNGLLLAFSDFKSPVIKNISKSDAVLYKALINHRFLYELMRGKKDFVLHAYKILEKKFERDGLFWLQYGLALRDFLCHEEALEKLRIAYEAYPMPHTQHALAQQMLTNAGYGDDRSLSIGLADEAKKMLEKLDDVIDSDDTYPCVTLAEGYTRVLRKHTTEAEARAFATAQSFILGQKAKNGPADTRLESAYRRLFKYASTGFWDD